MANIAVEMLHGILWNKNISKEIKKKIKNLGYNATLSTENSTSVPEECVTSIFRVEE
jgi:hypothetical protein